MKNLVILMLIWLMVLSVWQYQVHIHKNECMIQCRERVDSLSIETGKVVGNIELRLIMVYDSISQLKYDRDEIDSSLVVIREQLDEINEINHWHRVMINEAYEDIFRLHRWYWGTDTLYINIKRK